MSDDDDAPEETASDQESIDPFKPFDAGDASEVGKRRRKVAIQERNSARFWEYIFGLEIGRREMFKLLRDCHAFEDRFACGPNGFPQPEATWFQAGESAWGRRLVQTWMVDHTEAFALMLRENDPRFQKGSK